MGADGWIYILDADIVDSKKYKPHKDFNNAYLYTFMGKRIYTIYADTEHCDLERNDGRGSDWGPEHTFDDYEDIGAVIDRWEIWT